tara:strand:- start:25231 stop:25695 length:465 start_codon:yes stop_codon:yes gene_type:complete
MNQLVTICAAVLLCLGTPSPGYAESTDKHNVERAFVAWQKGTGSPFSLLADDAKWTILGPTPSAGTYSRSDLETKILAPFNKRLATPLTPGLIGIFQDNDTIVALFEARATLITGEEYHNSYAWFLTMEDGLVTEVTAVLDVSSFDRVMTLALD